MVKGASPETKKGHVFLLSQVSACEFNRVAVEFERKTIHREIEKDSQTRTEDEYECNR